MGKTISAIRWPLPLPQLLFFITILLALHVMVGMNNSVFQGNFLDTDVYSWLNRVDQLHEQGDWFDRRLRRINPPHGHTQHWSRPFDVVLYAGGALGAPFVGFRAALEAWAVWVSPFLHVLTLVALLFAVRPVFPRSRQQLPIVAALFVGQSALLVGFAVGRADHQSLLLLLCTLALGCAVRMFADGAQRSWCYMAGFVCALGVWVSVEFMLIVGVIQFAAGLFWLRESVEPGSVDHSQKMSRFSLALLLGGSAALYAHNGRDAITSLATDEISLLYWMLFSGSMGFWVTARVVVANSGLQRWVAKATFAAVGCSVVGGVVLWVLGDGLTGPLGDVDSLYERVRLANLGELHPIVSIEAIAGGDYFHLFNRAIPGLGLIIPAVWCLTKGGLSYWRDVPSPLARAGVLNAIGILIFVSLACYQIRWLGYAALLIIPAASWGVVQFLNWLDDRLRGRRIELIRLLVVAAFALGFNFAPALVEKREGGTATRTTQGSSLAGVADFLRDTDTFGSPLNVLAFVDYGPELVYRTRRHSVFAMPNHRPQPGFIASYTAMSAATDDVALPILHRLGVNLILVRNHPTETSFYANEAGLETFHSRLLSGRVPSWLIELPMPQTLAAEFRLFRMAGVK